MTVHPTALLAILLMAIVTYLTRVSGYWLMGRVTISPRIERALNYLPGCVLISLVVPATVEEGLPGIVALAATAIAMRRWNNLLVAMIAGVGTIWLLRQVTG